MARTIQEIKKDMTDAWMGDDVVIEKYNIEPGDTFEVRFKKPHPENILFYVMAFAIYIYERIFDTKRDELTAYVDAMRPHTREWYIKIMKQYQHGDVFDESIGSYETVDENKQIVKFCSVSSKTTGVLEYKIAAANASGNPETISGADISSITSYINRVKDAGVRCLIFSNPPDKFRCRIDIVYDPTLLNIDGSKVDEPTGFPILDAMRQYFYSFPFDGYFSNMALTDAIQQVPGVVVVQIMKSEAKYAEDIVGAQWTVIDSTYNPRSGYMTFDENDIDINYHL